MASNSRAAGRATAAAVRSRRHALRPAPGPLTEPLESRSLLSASALDPSFGTDGYVLVGRTGSRSDYADAVTVQADGKILAAGDSNTGLALARYNPDGSLDPTFGAGGFALPTADLPSDLDVSVQLSSTAVSVGPSGAITVVRTSYDRFTIYHLLANGSLDAASGGVITVSSQLGSTNAVAIQPDGHVLVASSNSAKDVVLQRYNADGTPDASFGAAGTVTTDFGGKDYPAAIALRPDGRILLAGESQTPNAIYSYLLDPSVALASYNPDGSPDGTFGGDGIVTTHIGGDSEADFVAVAPDGKVVVAGKSWNDILVARYNADGSLDTSFHSTGSLVTPYTGTPTALAVSAAGQIVVGAPAASTSAGFFLVSSDGVLSPVTTVFPTTLPANSAWRAATFDPDGHLLLAGYTAQSLSSGTPGGGDFALARYNADGTPDATFDADGKLTTDLVGPVDRSASHLILQPDGKVLTGFTRYNPDGTLDPTFGSGGDVTVDLRPAHFWTNMMAMALQPDGKVVYGGIIDRCFGLIRLNPDGSFDPTFGTNGVMVDQVQPSNWDSIIHDLAVLPDGRIVAFGQASQPNSRLHLRVYNPDGTLNASPDINWVAGFAASLAVTADGKFLLAGNYGSSLTLLRLNPDFSLDTSFNASPSAPVYPNATKLLIQPDGRILVADTTDLGPAAAQVFRLNADGTPDATFTPILLQSNVAGLRLLPDGKIVLAGVDAAHKIVVTRLNPNGSLDATFGAHGSVTTDLGASATAAGIAVLPDGNYVVAATRTGLGSNQTAILHYLADQAVPADPAPPTVTSVLPDVSAASVTLTLTFSAGAGLNPATLASSNVRVTDPAGHPLAVTFLSAESPDGTTTRATYRVAAPGGSWDAADNGAYAVSLLPDQVADQAGHTVPATDLGSFQVNLPTQNSGGGDNGGGTNNGGGDSGNGNGGDGNGVNPGGGGDGGGDVNVNTDALVASPAVVSRKGKFTLTAPKALPGLSASTNRVLFYRDANGNHAYDPSDPLLGAGRKTAAGWVFSGTAVKLPVGDDYVLARAFAKKGAATFLGGATITVQNAPPTVAKLTAGPKAIRPGSKFTLAATGAKDPDGRVTSYQFALDTNGNGILDADDQVLSTQRSTTYRGTAAGTAGDTLFAFVRVRDDSGTWGNAVRTTIKLT